MPVSTKATQTRLSLALQFTAKVTFCHIFSSALPTTSSWHVASGSKLRDIRWDDLTVLLYFSLGNSEVPETKYRSHTAMIA